MTGVSYNLNNKAKSFKIYKQYLYYFVPVILIAATFFKMIAYNNFSSFLRLFDFFRTTNC